MAFSSDASCGHLTLPDTASQGSISISAKKFSRGLVFSKLEYILSIMENLQAFARKHDIKLVDIADELGCSVSTISRKLRDPFSLYLVEAIRLHRMFNRYEPASFTDRFGDFA